VAEDEPEVAEDESDVPADEPDVPVDDVAMPVASAAGEEYPEDPEDHFVADDDGKSETRD
jgi:hypothetical protein